MSIKAWGDEQEKELIRLYTEEEIRDVHQLSEYFDGKGYRSVISKLVQLKIYQKPTDMLEEKAKTVKTMLREIELLLDVEIEGINLNKKENLVIVVEALNAKLGK
jgi:hypothetical protein